MDLNISEYTTSIENQYTMFRECGLAYMELVIAEHRFYQAINQVSEFATLFYKPKQYYSSEGIKEGILKIFNTFKEWILKAFHWIKTVLDDIITNRKIDRFLESIRKLKAQLTSASTESDNSAIQRNEEESELEVERALKKDTQLQRVSLESVQGRIAKVTRIWFLVSRDAIGIFEAGQYDKLFTYIPKEDKDDYWDKLQKKMTSQTEKVNKVYDDIKEQVVELNQLEYEEYDDPNKVNKISSLTDLEYQLKQLKIEMDRKRRTVGQLENKIAHAGLMSAVTRSEIGASDRQEAIAKFMSSHRRMLHTIIHWYRQTIAEFTLGERIVHAHLHPEEKKKKKQGDSNEQESAD